MSTFLKKWWPTCVVVLVILYATWVPRPIDPNTLPPIPGIDKLIHAIMMGGLAGAILFDRRRANRKLQFTNHVVARVCIGVMIFSAFDEFVQGMLPIGRPSDVLDLLADWGGAIIGCVLAQPAINMVLPIKE